MRPQVSNSRSDFCQGCIHLFEQSEQINLMVLKDDYLVHSSHPLTTETMGFGVLRDQSRPKPLREK